MLFLMQRAGRSPKLHRGTAGELSITPYIIGSNGGVLNETLRVLAVIPGAATPVAFVFARRQMASVAMRGHKVEIFDLRGRRSPFALLRSLAAYRRHIRQFRPDVVHAHYGTMTGFFSVFGALGLAPVVVTFRGSDLNPVPLDPPLQVKLGHFLSQLAALGAAAIVCVSAELRGRLWWGRGKVTLVPTGVDAERFQPGDRRAARQSLGWDHDRPAVLFAAQAAGKRLQDAREVIALTREAVPDLEFVVVDGSFPPDRMPLLMQACDCLLFTSDYEGSPTMIQEAMASALPVVSVVVGDVAERLRDVTPSRVTARNPRALADALIEILTRRERSNGREIALRDVANEAIMKRLEQAYAIARRGRPSASSASKSANAP
jgi:glycosyltransferase involved in cell wall biosynthesis